MKKKGLVLLLFWAYVSAEVCQHPALIFPEEIRMVLVVNDDFISCTVEKKNSKTIRHNGNVTSTELEFETQPVSGQIVTKANKTICVDGIERYTSPNHHLNETASWMFNENNVTFVLKKTKVFEVKNAKFYNFSTSKNSLTYALLFIDDNYDDCIFLKIFDEVVTKKNKTIFWKTDMRNAMIARNTSIDSIWFGEVDSSLKDLSYVFISKQMAYHQMWLECKFLHFSTFKESILSEYMNAYLLYIIGWILFWFVVGVIINFITLWSIKSFRINILKYIWCCINQALSLSVVCNSFLDENELLHQQLYLLVENLYAGKKVIIVTKNNRKSYFSYDYITALPDYIELVQSNRMSVPVLEENIYENASELCRIEQLVD